MADVTYKEQALISYDDNLQTAIVMETKDGPFGIKLDLPVVKVRTLHHDLLLLVIGPDEQGIRDRALECLESSAVKGALAGVVAAFVAPTHAWAVAEAAAVAAFTQCAEESVHIHLEDRSHWTDWDNPFSGGGGGGRGSGGRPDDPHIRRLEF